MLSMNAESMICPQYQIYSFHSNIPTPPPKSTLLINQTPPNFPTPLPKSTPLINQTPPNIPTPPLKSTPLINQTPPNDPTLILKVIEKGSVKSMEPIFESIGTPCFEKNSGCLGGTHISAYSDRLLCFALF